MVRTEFKVHSLAAAKTRKPRHRQPSTPVVTRIVNQEVWRTALDLADGDWHRLQVIDTNTVIVHNHHDWSKK